MTSRRGGLVSTYAGNLQPMECDICESRPAGCMVPRVKSDFLREPGQMLRRAPAPGSPSGAPAP